MKGPSDAYLDEIRMYFKDNPWIPILRTRSHDPNLSERAPGEADLLG